VNRPQKIPPLLLCFLLTRSSQRRLPEVDMMQDKAAAYGGRRDFVDVMWQIAEKRCCDEVLIRYDCGHALKAEVWVPVLPRTREYSNQEADRRRFMQHSIFVLTKNPGAPKVQITVPEGRCRHCGRGQRQGLLCGPLHMDLSEERHADRRRADLAKAGPGALRRDLRDAASLLAMPARRLDLPLSSHVFLAAMGQVCRLPDNITPPPLLQNSSILQSGTLRPFEGPGLSREGLRQWSRKEIEDELKAEVVKYVGGATFLLLFVVIECLYLCVLHFGPSTPPGGNNSTDANASLPMVSTLSNATTNDAEMDSSNATWFFSAFTFSMHKAFTVAGTDQSGRSSWWWYLLRPFWLVLSILLAPLLWVLDMVAALPRFLFLHVAVSLVRAFVWRPCSWLLGILTEVVSNSVLIFRYVFLRPTAMLSQIPMTNPMVVAMVLSILVAAFSAPQPPSLSLPSVHQLVQQQTSGAVMPLVQRLRHLWASARREARPKGGIRGIPAARGQKDKPHVDRSGRDRTDVPGRPEKPQTGRQDGRVPSGSSSQSAPACFVCLDRPSRYILEPCGHRVVCGDCAIQLVDAAARSRSTNEVAGTHHSSERGGGACPSCGYSIMRAMRVFS